MANVGEIIAQGSGGGALDLGMDEMFSGSSEVSFENMMSMWVSHFSIMKGLHSNLGGNMNYEIMSYSPHQI